MNIHRGFISFVREDINYNAFLNHLKLNIDIETKIAIGKTTDMVDIDTVGLKIRIIVLNKLTGEEVVGYIAEAGVVFDTVETPKNDWKELEIVARQAFERAVAYLIELLPDGLLTDGDFKKPDFKERSGAMLLNLIDFGLYE